MDVFQNAMFQVHGFQIRHFFKKGKNYYITIWCGDDNLTEKFAKQLGLKTVEGQIDITDNYNLLTKIVQHLEIVSPFYGRVPKF